MLYKYWILDTNNGEIQCRYYHLLVTKEAMISPSECRVRMAAMPSIICAITLLLCLVMSYTISKYNTIVNYIYK